MSANVNELFDRIFENNTLVNRYLASLMSSSENEETLQIKRKQVQLLRNYFIQRNDNISDKYLSLLDDIERILDRDSKQFMYGAETEEGL